MNILETIKDRKSVRNYTGAPLTPGQKDIIEKAIANADSPFGGHYTIRLRDYAMETDFKPGTYGVIKGAVSYLLMAVGEGERDMLSAGFAMEKVVLEAWQNGLATCWIAATFKGTDFDRDITWPEGERLRIVSPIGEASEKRSMIDRLTRTLARSNKRRPFDELFFYGDADTPMSSDCEFGQALSMMRLAPSSTNSQPWRAVVDGADTVHFYSASSAKVAILNCGIGLCHFTATEQFYGREGEFRTLHAPIIVPSDWRYITSYIRRSS